MEQTAMNNIIETVKRKLHHTSSKSRGVQITIPIRFADKLRWEKGDSIDVSLIVEDGDYDHGYLILKKE